MPSFEIRPFRRSDREQVTTLVNRHVAAVVPGVSISVNTVLNRLEREPGEFIVDPWVSERTTLVAEQHGGIVAAAHLLRFADEERVGVDFRNAGSIRWFLFWPLAPTGSPYRPDATAAAEALLEAAVEQFERWGVERQYADGTLPAPGVYGVPEQWPHIQTAYERAGFIQDGGMEIVLIANVDHLPRVNRPPLEGLAIRRSVGINGTRFSAVLGDEVIGYLEVETLEHPGTLPAQTGLADIGNLHVIEAYRRRGVGTWLLAQAADWLRLAGVHRLLDYAAPEEKIYLSFLEATGFQALTRTRRGWTRERPAHIARPSGAQIAL